LFAHGILLSLILLTPPQTDRVGFRIITVSTESQAAELRARIVAGESFGALAQQHSSDASAAAGGLMDSFALSDLRTELRTALTGLAPGQISPVQKMDGEFFLVQWAPAGEADWAKENSAAAESFQKGRYADAVRSFSRAVQLAEKFGADDDRLGESLNGLAETYRLQENFSEAGPIFRRILSIRWSSAANKGDVAVANVVDQFADLVGLAYFRGSRFEEALKRYREALDATPVNEALYLAMSSIFVKAELTAEAADVMQRAVRAFPASRRIRYEEAEMHRDSGRMRKALETFQAASQMKAPAGMPVDRDRQQHSFIYQRIGGINTDLAELDAAIDAYKKALEISPENADARIALGDVYLRRGQQAEAIAEYTRLTATHSDSALLHYRIADAYLQMGRFSESATAASRALQIDPQLRKARFVRGTALVRSGRIEEGQMELEHYRKQEAQVQADINNQRDILVLNRGAAAQVLQGQAEEGIASFRKGIQAHPGAASLRLNLGVALETLGRFREAAATLQTTLDGGIGDDFLIYRSLARVYGSLKDEKAAHRHAALYIRQIDGALERELQ
jgi:tetratricopeptide (TPR) repeat protein